MRKKGKEKGKDLGGKAKNVFFRTSSRGCCRNRGKFKLANLSNGLLFLGYTLLFFFFLLLRLDVHAGIGYMYA